jgi:melanoma-associated antigen p97
VVAEFQSNDPGGNTWSCVQNADAAACVTALQNRQVDYYVVSPGVLYDAIPLGVRVIGYEEYPVGAAAYYAVAIVRKEDCDKNPALTIADYRGKASCHTGYGRTAGWNMPIGHYVSTGVMTPVNRDPALSNDIETVQNFFGKTCAPGDVGEPRICTLCPEEKCVASNSSNYYDYDGVLYCVEKGGGDIGFTKHDVIGSYAAGQPKAKEWAEAPVGEFRILCPNGGCTTFNDFQRCNAVTVPSRAIVTYAEATPASIGEFQTILAALNSDPQFVDLVLRGANSRSYMFQSDTIRLDAYNGTAQAYMGAAFGAYTSMDALEANTPLTAGAFSVTSGFAVYGVIASAVAVVVALF